MRKFALMVLLAATAVPAMAQSDDDRRGQRGQSGGDPSAQSNDDRETYRQMRSSRSDRQDNDRSEQTARRGDGDDGAREARRAQRFQQQQADQAQQQAMQAQQAASNGEAEARRQRQSQQNAQDGGGDRSREFGQRRFEGRRDRDAQVPVMGEHGVRQWSGRQRDGQAWNGQADGQQSSGWQQRERRVRTIPDTNIVRPEGMRGPERHVRDGERRRYDRDGTRWGNYRWSQHWRGDPRFDWRRYRDRNRSSFRLGFYFDPFGWNYRRFNIGTYLWPNYYSQNYWISDPWRYRLPPAYGPYRWVRYHNDALLIDTWTGQVVDVIYGFFW